MHQAADTADNVLRISMDAKATVKVGPFARGGHSRASVAAVDHDFHPTAPLTPVGIFLPAWEALFVDGVTAKVTRDGWVDRFAQCWETVHERFAPLPPLVRKVENGPEPHSRRTQCMQRLVDGVQPYQVTVRRASYPPYQSPYNPIERCWGILANHGNGALLDAIDVVRQFTATMTWKGTHPIVDLVTTTYQTGVTLTKEAMAAVETQSIRWPGLEKWLVDIVPSPSWLWAP